MADVFISYAREDRARAEQVAHGLEAAGLDVFWDSEIPPGQTWADYIEAKLSQCKAVVVLWSVNSTGSQWVREEARMGRDKGRLIPAMIDSSQAPFGFSEVQAANLANWTGQNDHPEWRRFVEAVTGFAGRSGAPRAPQPMRSAPPRAEPAASSGAPAKKGLPPWAWAVGGAAALLVVLIVIGMNVDDDSKPVEDGKPEEIAAGQSTETAPVQAPVAAVSPPTTDGSPQAIILAQLQQAQGALTQQGFQQVGEPFSGSLQQGQTWNVPASLYAGYDYRIVGVCDRDCADLDLVLFDPNGASVSQDTSADDHPVVSAAPSANGTFTIQVQMYNCSVAPCYYAVALFGRALQ